jgi:hypothetical protein
LIGDQTNQSGRAIQLLQQAGMAELGPYILQYKRLEGQGLPGDLESGQKELDGGTLDQGDGRREPSAAAPGQRSRA